MADKALPRDFLTRLAQIVPAHRLDSVVEGLGERRSVALRVNSLRTDVSAVVRHFAEKGIALSRVAGLPNALAAPRVYRQQITHDVLAGRGDVYVQDLSSQWAVAVLNPLPDEEVLDLCAAPGGKTLDIAARINNRGRVAAVEAVRSRWFKLRANVRRSGASAVRCYLMDGRHVDRKTPGRFDRALVDAPCSSEARFCVGRPASWKFWSLKKIGECVRKQYPLIRSAFAALRPGGVLVYCTCTFAPEENEAIVARLVQCADGHADIEQVNLPLTNLQSGLRQFDRHRWPAELSKCLRLLPTSGEPNESMDALFIARIRKG